MVADLHVGGAEQDGFSLARALIELIREHDKEIGIEVHIASNCAPTGMTMEGTPDLDETSNSSISIMVANMMVIEILGTKECSFRDMASHEITS